MREPSNIHETNGDSVTVGLPKNRPDHSVTKDTWGYTYFVQRGNAIKIGHSAIPKQRISGLQVAFAEPLEILAIVPNTIVDEATAHEKFAHLRLSGEWFRAEPELIEFILSVKLQLPKPKPASNATENARNVIAQLRRLRDAHGHETAIGHTCSNLLEQIPLMANYVRPAWAVDERQTLPWLIKWQMKRLAELMSPAFTACYS